MEYTWHFFFIFFFMRVCAVTGLKYWFTLTELWEEGGQTSTHTRLLFRIPINTSSDCGPNPLPVVQLNLAPPSFLGQIQSDVFIHDASLPAPKIPTWHASVSIYCHAVKIYIYVASILFISLFLSFLDHWRLRHCNNPRHSYIAFLFNFCLVGCSE